MLASAVYKSSACGYASDVTLPHADVRIFMSRLLGRPVCGMILLRPGHCYHHRDAFQGPPPNINRQSKGLQHVPKDRLARRSGGVAVVVTERLQFLVPEDSRNLELIWIKIQLQKENLYVGALYHPPKPIYESVQLLDRLERTVNAIVEADPDGLLILGGGFNSLKPTSSREPALYLW